MWLYSATVLTAFTYLVCSSNLFDAKKRHKKDGSHTPSVNYRRRYRLSSADKEEIQIPMKIPKLSRAQKIALIIESGQNPFEKKRKRKEKGKIRLRKLRHVRQYPNNAYLLLDDNDGDELQWNLNMYRETVTDKMQKQKQQEEESRRFENSRWEADMELATTTTTTLIKTEWEKIKKSYNGSNNWESSTLWYWDTSTNHPTYWDTSMTSNFWQTSTKEPFWRQNIETVITTTTTTAISPIIDSIAFKTTSAAPVPDVTEEFIWVATPVSSPKSHQPIALPIKSCPHRFDAVTRAFNGRTYVFARDRVYQLWRHDNLHQKASFLVSEMFPKGPRTVTVAYTNNRSGVTVLIEHQTVYRYRWNRKNKIFYLARKSPQTLTKKIPVYPRAGFQWVDGNQVLVEGDNFATYDAYWNVATFSGLTTNYFPQFPRDLIGLTYQNDTFFILYTASNKIQHVKLLLNFIHLSNKLFQIYDTGKYRVIQEYPIQISEFVGCFNG
ncbi:unnamed protein product [Wuchereria bancrofti]|uniref:Olfactomedin-like domain-containing protein n=2 Tax=Wuchereria bancrofti TaxID=6293 RepID=A0A3P7DKD8_WUCBA|nr:unnamed protein product [Wuchereria bancrofti]